MFSDVDELAFMIFRVEDHEHLPKLLDENEFFLLEEKIIDGNDVGDEEK